MIETAVQVLVLLLVVYLLLVAVMYAGQRRVLYLPDRRRPDPAASGVPEMRPVTLTTVDGLELLAWWRPPQGAGKGTILYFHGNGGHMGYRGFKVRPYLDAGLGLLMLEYRGYGGNPGWPHEAGLYADGRAALAFAAAAGVPPEQAILYGESLGSAIAVRLAGETGVAAIILEAPFTSVTDIGAHRFPWLPVRAFAKDRFDSMARIRAIAAPLLVLHGEHDWIVPPAFGHALYDAAPHPKEAVFFPEAGHNNLYRHGAAETVLSFLARRSLA